MNRRFKIRLVIYGFVILILTIAFLTRKQPTEITVAVLEDQTVVVAGDTVRIDELGDKLAQSDVDRRTEIVISSAGDAPMTLIHDVREEIELIGGVNIEYRVKESGSKIKK